MSLLKRELCRRRRGPVANYEDWWHLVFDTESKLLYIEHEWSHTDVRENGTTDSGTAKLTISDYLRQAGDDDGHRELLRLIHELFTPSSRRE